MVDCFDRIAVQMTEIALEPIEQLATRPTMMAATVRLPSGGRSILLTVRKRFAEGEDSVPSYGWKLDAYDASADGTDRLASSAPETEYPKPQDAFWAAVDALRDVNLGQQAAR